VGDGNDSQHDARDGRSRAALTRDDHDHRRYRVAQDGRAQIDSAHDQEVDFTFEHDTGTGPYGVYIRLSDPIDARSRPSALHASCDAHSSRGAVGERRSGTAAGRPKRHSRKNLCRRPTPEAAAARVA
jgi:hypothetical protein